MQTSVRTDALPSAPPLPAEHGANEKLASGLQGSQVEANVWETQTFTPQMRWGNDDMHARYYNPNLGRFLSVDPIGGEVGSSQSWNRYSYALNSPLKNVDPNGEAVVTAYSRNREHAEAQYRAVEFVATGGMVSGGFSTVGEGAASVGGRLLRRFRGAFSSVRSSFQRWRAVRAALRSANAGTRLEGEAAQALGRQVTGFQRVVEAAGSRIGEIDVETATHIVEATVDKGGKFKQVMKLITNSTMNPEGKQVVVLAPNLKEGAAKQLQELGAEVVRTVEDLKAVVLK